MLIAKYKMANYGHGSDTKVVELSESEAVNVDIYDGSLRSKYREYNYTTNMVLVMSAGEIIIHAPAIKYQVEGLDNIYTCCIGLKGHDGLVSLRVPTGIPILKWHKMPQFIKSEYRKSSWDNMRKELHSKFEWYLQSSTQNLALDF